MSYGTPGESRHSAKYDCNSVSGLLHPHLRYLCKLAPRKSNWLEMGTHIRVIGIITLIRVSLTRPSWYERNCFASVIYEARVTSLPR